MDQTFLWAIAGISFLALVKTLLDAFGKSNEAEIAHAEHHGREIPRVSSGWSPKEKTEFASIMVGFAVSLGGFIFAAAKASSADMAAVTGICVGLALLVMVSVAAWVSWLYAKKRKATASND